MNNNQNEIEKSLFEILFVSNHSIMLLIDPKDGEIVDANKAAVDFYGFSHEQFIKMNIKNINIHSEDLIYEEMQKVKSKKQNYFNFKHKLSSGIIKDVEVYSGEIVLKERLLLFSIIHDITKRLEYQKKLIDKENELQTLFNGIKDAVFVHPFLEIGFASFVNVNDHACERYGYTKEEFLKLSAKEITFADDANEHGKSEFRTKLSVNKNMYFRTQHISKNGEMFPVEINSNISEINGKKYIIAVVRDISERINNEKILLLKNDELKIAKEKAEKSDRLKTEFLHNLSHEIRTPMNAIIGFSDFLENENLTKDKRKQYLKIIKSSGNQLLRVIDDVLEISALETKHVKVINEEFSLNVLLENIFTIFQGKAYDKNISLYLKKGLTNNNCFIVSDKLKLEKILNNLIENAIKYTNDGKVEIEYSIKDEKIVINIKDTGIGISKDKYEKIFERFSRIEDENSFQTRGLGLGLSIVKENIQLLGGDISLVSEIGKGTTFSILLPYVRWKINNDVKKLSQNKILIAEDDEINFLYIETILSSIFPDLEIVQSTNGKETIDFCHEQDFDLIFMDIKMPFINGFDATQEILKFKPNQKIIALTAYSSLSDSEKAKQVGCVDFASKPISKNTLKELLDKHLSQNH